MPSCFFNKKPKALPEDYLTKLLFYKEKAEAALASLGGDFEVIQDIQGRNFSVTYLPRGLSVQTRADTAIDYWASIVEAVDRINMVAEADIFKP